MADDEQDDDLHPMSQDEIDALFAEAMGDTGQEPPPEPEEAEAPEAGADEDVGAPVPAEAGPSETAPAQDPSPPPATAAVPAAPVTDEVEATLQDLSGSDAAEAEAEEDAIEGPSQATPTAQVSQSDIDALLAELGGGSDEDESASGSAKASPATGDLSAGGPPTEAITAESLAELVNKHSGDGDESSGANATGMIDQGDIDALVAQMSVASGDEVPDRDQIAAALEDHGDDIDALLEQAGSSSRSIGDAVSPSLIRDVVASGGKAQATVHGAVMSSEELRGTRYLLVAAVFLLMMCAVTLGFVVASINGLTAELTRSNQDEATAGDDFGDDMAVAERWLQADDEVTVTKGVNFLEEELKARYPRKREVIAERLAHHYRSVGAHRQAVAEFAYIADRKAGLLDDPRFYLEYADSLAEIGEQQRAREIAYELVANEAWFLRPTLPDGTEVPTETIARHREILREGQVLLGRLYSPVIDAESDRIAEAGS